MFCPSGQLDQYCADIAEMATWGGQLEVRRDAGCTSRFLACTLNGFVLRKISWYGMVVQKRVASSYVVGMSISRQGAPGPAIYSHPMKITS